MDAAKAKWWSAQVQNEILDACVQLHGGYGYMNEYRVARAWRDARVTKIWAGSNEIMKELIGRDLGPMNGLQWLKQSSSPPRGRRSAGRSRGRCGCRPDDLADGVIRRRWPGCPALDPADLDDLYLGCAEPHDEHGGNMARRVAVQLGLDGVPAVTVNRFCASSLQTARMAFHAIKAGEGDAFVSAGVECVSRYRGFAHAGVDPEAPQPVFADAEQRTLAYAGSNTPGTTRAPTAGCPTSTSRWARRRSTSPPLRGISRAEQDEFGVRSQNLAEKAIANGVFEAEIAPVILPDGST